MHTKIGPVVTDIHKSLTKALILVHRLGKDKQEDSCSVANLKEDEVRLLSLIKIQKFL